MAATRAEIRLEEFAQRVAAAGPMPGAIKQEGSFYYFHCPFTGPAGDPHGAKGAPRVYLWIAAGEVHAHCDKCLGPKSEHSAADLAEARQGYTDQLKDLIRWEHDPIEPRAKPKVLRTHLYYDRDLKHQVLKDKLATRGEAKFGWRARPIGVDGAPNGPAVITTAEEFRKAHYPDYEQLYAALHWYGIEQRVDDPGSDLKWGPYPIQRPDTVLIMEGEKDADSCNAMIAAAGQERSFFATCLSHPKPSKLSAHHLPLITGARIAIIPDQDTAGRAAADNWARLVWGRAKTVKIVRDALGLSGKPDDKDFTDWLTKNGGPSRASFDKLIAILVATAPEINPPDMQSDHDFTDDGLMLQLGAAWKDKARYVAGAGAAGCFGAAR